MSEVDDILGLPAVSEMAGIAAVRAELDAHFQRICLKLDAIDKKIELRFDALMATVGHLSSTIAANHEAILHAIESSRNGEQVAVTAKTWTN